jgi:hypothetical protein
MRDLVKVLLGVCLICIGVLPVLSAVEMNAELLFTQQEALDSTTPILVRLKNTGNPIEGQICVSPERFGTRRTYNYPISLPTGSYKEIIVTPRTQNSVGRVKISLEAPRTIAEAEVETGYRGTNARMIVSIGDEIGGLQLPESNQNMTYLRSFCQPERFPETADACSGISVFVFALGAERLSGNQIRAMKLWVLTGGLLVVPGGSGAIYLKNPELASMLPSTNFNTQQVENLSSLGSFTKKTSPSGTAVITVSTPKLDAQTLFRQGNIPMATYRQYGRGGVLFLSFSFWDIPVKGWDAQPAFWKEIIKTFGAVIPNTFLNGLSDFDSAGYGYPPENETLFNLPDTSTVVWLLVAYFILVVPINYYVLKRLRALDWAWVTAPVIALVFVFCFYQLGRSIYSVGHNARTDADVVAQSGEPLAYVRANTMFFFPQAGNYSLEFAGAEMVEGSRENDYDPGFSMSNSLATIQGDPVIVPALTARNLSFKHLEFTRVLDLQGTFIGDLKCQIEHGKYRLKGKLTNGLSYPLTNIRLLFIKNGTSQYVKTVKTLEGGKSTEVDGATVKSIPGLVDPRSSYYSGPVEMRYENYYYGTGMYAIVLADADQPNVSPTLEVVGHKSQTVRFWFHIPIQLEGGTR